jgi:1,4-dihydroxy-2-naphthoyl-CoA synthase
MNFEEACRFESGKFAALFGNGESGEGMNAFLGKRKPNW